MIVRGQSDCSNAIKLREDFTATASGPGSNEISDSDPQSLYWFEKEHNTCWIIITADRTGLLTLDIAPSKENDDIDFLLFRYTGASFCEDIRLKKIKPVRSNLSRTQGHTGLSRDAKDDYTHSGPGNAWCRTVSVTKGEVFYLVVDYFTAGGGVLSLDASIIENNAVKVDPKSVIDASPVKVGKLEAKLLTVPLHVKISDEETGQPLKANISIEGIVPGSAVKLDSTAYSAELSSSQSIRIECNAPGYLFTSESIMAPSIDPFTSTEAPAPIDLEIKMKKIRVGEKVALRNIQFQPDKAEFLSSSWSDLQNLTSFLQANPSAKIEIGGHINGPDGSSHAGTKMSAKRAKAVYDYLLKRGISKKRLKYKGYGNKQMIYPQPANERQAEENRRVEIKILSID
jgi:outer membrane protein OmpA-like peptidoglycan-associated protein